jgi:AraC-like DNA-binding protein
MQHIAAAWTGYEQKASLFHWLQLFLIYCNKLKTEQSAPPDDDTYAVVGNFTTLIERNFKQTQKVNDYCDQLYLTYNTLARYTQNYCGKSPKEIIAERVTLEAKRLLVTSAMPIKEIAYTLGFDEPTNLVKYFKKQTGFTPATFRENFTTASA